MSVTGSGASTTTATVSRSRSTTARAPSVDVLVGADGIHSDVRAALFGPEDPVFTGCAAYRGLVPAERLRTSSSR